MKILGILNITEDSFYDGGLYLKETSAIAQANRLIEEGADIIDIGAQSSNIHSHVISAEAEWQRLLPVIELLKEKKVKISIDTFKTDVIRKCLEIGIDYINNISAFNESEALEVLGEYRDNLPELIIMFSHSQGNIAQLGSQLTLETIWEDIFYFFDKKLEELQKYGVSQDKIILDPGMGFFLGDDPELSFTVLRGLGRFREKFGRILISVSRKSFLGTAIGGLPPKDRGIATVIAELYAYIQGVDYLRTHDPLSLKQAITIWDRINP